MYLPISVYLPFETLKKRKNQKQNWILEKRKEKKKKIWGLRSTNILGLCVWVWVWLIIKLKVKTESSKTRLKPCESHSWKIRNSLRPIPSLWRDLERERKKKNVRRNRAWPSRWGTKSLAKESPSCPFSLSLSLSIYIYFKSFNFFLPYFLFIFLFN